MNDLSVTNIQCARRCSMIALVAIMLVVITRTQYHWHWWRIYEGRQYTMSSSVSIGFTHHPDPRLVIVPLQIKIHPPCSNDMLWAICSRDMGDCATNLIVNNSPRTMYEVLGRGFEPPNPCGTEFLWTIGPLKSCAVGQAWLPQLEAERGMRFFKVAIPCF